MLELITYILLFAIGYGFYLGRKSEIDDLASKMQNWVDKLFD